MLTDVVQTRFAVRLAPQPAFGAIETGTVQVGVRARCWRYIRTWQVPERQFQLLSVDPVPRRFGTIRARLPVYAQPVLAAQIGTVSSVELPAEETLQCRRGFVHQSAATYLT